LVKKLIAAAGVFLVITPVMPLYAMTLIGEMAHGWGWPNSLCDCAERIEAWGRR
jgi:hypothetical protein